MKKIFTLFFLSFELLSASIQAQIYTTDVPVSAAFDSTYIVAFSITDSIDINNHPGYMQGQFLLCGNSTFIFKGNQSSSMPSFYLQPGSTLILKDSYFYPTVYMSGNSHLDALGGNQNINCYRDSLATLADTANVLWLKDSIYSQMNFSFTNWPNAASPCSLSPNSIRQLNAFRAYLTVQQGHLFYTLSSEKQTSLSVFDLQGRKLITNIISARGQIDLGHYASGIYIVHLQQGNEVVQQKILLD